MKKLLLLILCLLGLLTIIPAQAEQMQLEIIPLKHRMSSDIVPILKPLVVEGGSVSGMNNQLIVRTTPQNMREIMKTLKVLDRALRSLKISVRFDTQGDHHAREHGVDGHYDSRNVHIETRNPGSYSRNGQTVTVGGKHGQNNSVIRYKNWSTNSRTDDGNVYFVRTVEGQPAWIRTGESVPIPERTVVLHPYGTDVYDSVHYRDISSGFYVVPHLNGDRVTLMISPERSRVDTAYAGNVETQEAQMTITSHLGQWIDLGGVTEQYNEQSSEGLYRTRRYGSEQNRILVKVEEIR